MAWWGGLGEFARAGSVLVDFGNNSSFRGTNVVNPDANGNYWNSIWSGAYANNMLDKEGNATTIGLGFSSAGNTDYYNGPSGSSQNPAAVVIDAAALGDLGANNAVYDFYASSTFSIQGLDPAKTYDLTFYGSRKYTADATTIYTVYTSNDYVTAVTSASLNVRSPTQSWLHNSNTVVTITNVSPQYNNSIWIGFAGSGGGEGYLNALKLSYADDEPEPVSETVRILVDFGNNSSFRGTNVVSPDVNGSYWNSIHAAAYASSMLNTTGGTTSVGLGFSSAGGSDYYNGPSGATQDPGAAAIDAAALGLLGIQEAAYDWYNSSTFTIQGLDPGLTYDLTFFGSRKYVTDATTIYTVYTSNDYATAVTSASLNVRSPTQSWLHNSNTVVTITNVTPQYANSIWIGFDGSGGNEGYLNAMMITYTTGGTPAAAPEITRTPESLSYTTMAGTDPVIQTFTVTNSGGQTLYYTNTVSYSSGSGWLSVAPGTGENTASSSAANTHTSTVSVAGLSAGSFTGTITIAGNESTSATIPVTLTVTNIPDPVASVQVMGTKRTRYIVSEASGREMLVVYRAGSAPSAHPSQGVTYSQGASLGGGTILYKGSNVTNTHTVAESTVHYYRVYAINNDHYSPATSLVVTTAVLSATGDATVLIDLGNNSSFRGASVSNPDANGNYWNSVWSGAYANNMIDANGNATSLGLGFTLAGASDYFNGPSGSTADPAASDIDITALGSLGVHEAAYDFYASSKFTIQGLDSRRTYTLTFLGTRKFTAESATIYTVYTSNDYAVAVTSVTLNTRSPSSSGSHNRDTVVTISNVSPQYANSIWIGYEGATGGSGYLNALRIDYGTNAVVPVITRTPSSLSFTTMAGETPSGQSFTVTNSGASTLYYTNTISYSSGSGWLAIDPVSGEHTAGGAAANSHDATVDVAGLSAGSYAATITINGNEGASATLPVSLTVTGIPAPSASAVNLNPALDELTFSAEGDRDVLVVYRKDSAPSANPVNDTAYSVGNAIGGGSVIYKGSAATITHSVVLNSTHHYRFYAVHNNHYSAGVSAVTTSTVVRADGEVNILIDFGNDSSYRGASVSNPDVNGNYWNSIWSGDYFSGLLDRQGQTSSVSIGFSSAGATDYFNGPAGSTENPAAVVIDANALGEMGINEAAYDYYASSTFTIQNLDTNRTYDLTFYGSKKYADDAATIYTIYTSNDYTTAVASGSLNVRSPGASWLHNSNAVVIVTNIAPQYNNSIWVGYAGSGGSAGYLNALKITYINNQAPVAYNASQLTTNSFRASWSDVDAGSYRLDVSTLDDFSSFVAGYEDRVVSGTSETVSGLASAQTYYYRVRGIFNGVASDHSSTIAVTIPASMRPGVNEGNSSSTQAVYEATTGVTYDKYYSDDGGATWTLIDSETATGGAVSLDLDEGDSDNRIFTVKPSGAAPDADDAAGAPVVVKPSINAGNGSLTLMSIPVDSDGDLQGDLGDQLAAGLSNGAKVLTMSGGSTPTWTEFTLNNGTWTRTSGAGSYVLGDGQAFYLQNSGASSSLRFSGRVGNTGEKSASIAQGYNLIGIAEGKQVSASSAFESASPTGSLSEVNFDETGSDIVYIQRDNGSWRRLIRRADGTWYDTDNPNSSGNTGLQLQPGQAYYYLRRGGVTTLNY